MLRKKLLFVLSFLILTTLGCNLLRSLTSTNSPSQGADLIPTQTALALLARPTLQALEETATPLPGSIRGNLSYPSEWIPPLRVVAINLDTQVVHYVDTEENQATYQIDNLPPGTYHVLAYTRDGLFAAGYTQMVLCGLTVECTDHTLLPVTVIGGQVTFDIDPADWYAPVDAFPPNPIP